MGGLQYPIPSKQNNDLKNIFSLATPKSFPENSGDGALEKAGFSPV